MVFLVILTASGGVCELDDLSRRGFFGRLEGSG